MDRATFVSSDGLVRCCFNGAGKVSRCSEAVDRDCGAVSGDSRVFDGSQPTRETSLIQHHRILECIYLKSFRVLCAHEEAAQISTVRVNGDVYLTSRIKPRKLCIVPERFHCDA